VHADYALPLLHALGAGAGHTHLVRVQRLQFSEALERTVVLLVDRSASGEGEVEYREVADLPALDRLLASKALTGIRRRRRAVEDGDLAPRSRLATRLRWHLEPEEVQAWELACAHPHVSALGDVASVRIGVVTGANSWFIRTGREAERLGAEHVPVVARGAWLNGPSWHASQQRAVLDRRSRLLTLTSDAKFTPELLDEIARAERDSLHRRHHCAARSSWWSLTDVRRPELFLPYMGVRAPGLVLNWMKPGSPGTAALGVASWTSLWRLSAELHGRSYGGGVLKVEPCEAVRLRAAILPRDPGEAFAWVDDCWRRDGEAAARELADRLVLEDALSLPSAVVAALRAAAMRLEAAASPSELDHDPEPSALWLPSEQLALVLGRARHGAACVVEDTAAGAPVIISVHQL